MAYSFVEYVGDGATSQYVVPFPYLSTDPVSCTWDSNQVALTWIGPQTVSFPTAVPNGVKVRIARDSSRARRLANYADAQALTEEAMDADALQLFYVAQEAFDAVASAPTGGDMRRSQNLADVYDMNAARQNIQALAKYSDDTMHGRLYMTYSPVSPNEVATRGYVDALFAMGGSGVSSFNTRTGAVTLTSGDVTTALGYTPVNKAGDTMTGYLTLNGAPTSSLHAATKAYVDGATGVNLLPLNNYWTGWNQILKLDAESQPSFRVSSLKNGSIAVGDHLPGIGHQVTAEIWKTSNQSTDTATGGLHTGLLVQFKSAGTTTVNSFNEGIRAAVDLRGSKSGPVVNAGGSLTGATWAEGSSLSAWGVDAEITHNSSGTSESYAILSTVYRKNNTGYVAGNTIRVYNAAGFYPADAGLSILPFGTGAKAFSAIAVGDLAHGTFACDYGLDMRYMVPVQAAIALKENHKVQWGVTGGAQPVQSWYDQALGVHWTGVNGSPRMGVNINSGAYPSGTVFAWDGASGGASDYYMNLVGNGGVNNPVFSIRNAGRMPGSAATPATAQGFIPILIDGSLRYLAYY